MTFEDTVCMKKHAAGTAQVWLWPILPHKQDSNPEGPVGRAITPHRFGFRAADWLVPV